MKVKQVIAEDLKIQLVGYPQTTRHGLPYIRFEHSITGRYLGSLDRKNLLRLEKWIAIALGNRKNLK